MVTTTTGLATSFIQFTRTSNATVTDSNGFIKWAGHNLLTNSESFDASAWVKSSATVTANTDPAPNGTTTGDTIAASGANGTALQSYTALAVPYTFGVWLKRKTGTGTIEIAADNGTYTAVTITSSWALYTVTQTPAAGSKSAGIRIVSSGDEVYAWGAHLYRSDLGGMVLNPARGDAYYPTTPRNLLGFTEDFSNAAWNKINTTATSNVIIAPNGLQTADLVAATTGSSGTSVWQGGGPTWTSSSLVLFNLATGAVGTVTTGSFTSTSITPIGDGWYRCAAVKDGYTLSFYAKAGAWTCVALQTFGSEGMRIYPSTTSTAVTGTGDGASGVYLWGAQLSNSASLDAYSPVYGAAVTSAAYYAPRLDYDPVTLGAKGLLVEEQRVNLLLNSATLSTQNATVTAVAHTLSFYGTGTVTLSGASTAGPLVGTGAYPNRVTLTFTPTAGTLTLTVTGSVTQAQLEAGSFATSYIPTGAATATRTADVASVSTQAFPYSATEGTVVVNYDRVGFSQYSRLFTLGDVSGNNQVAVLNFNAGQENPYFVTSGAATTVTGPSIPAANSVSKMGLAFKTGASAYSLNGATATAVTTSFTLSATGLQLGHVTSAGQYLNGHIRQITYLPRRISNTELQQRTSV